MCLMVVSVVGCVVWYGRVLDRWCNDWIVVCERRRRKEQNHEWNETKKDNDSEKI